MEGLNQSFLLSVKELPWRFQLHTGIKCQGWLPSEMHRRSGHGAVIFVNHASNVLKAPTDDTYFMNSIRHRRQHALVV